MERTAFALLHESESSWWYRGRAAVIRGELDAIRARNLSILDFGAGYGGMSSSFARYGTVSAYEPDAIARSIAGARGYKTIYSTVENALAHRHDIIALCDVLEHMPNDTKFLQQAYASLGAGKRLLVTVPAMPFLWSSHDETHHHYRRYTKQTLRSVLENNGFVIERISYWNMFLFVPAALARLLGKSGESSLHLPRVVDALFYALVTIEIFFMKFISFPLGVSLIVVAHKK